MIMRPRLRKFALTAHIVSSVGWLGAATAYLALVVAGLTSQDAQTVRAAYLAMGLIVWFVIVPLSSASLLTGLVQALGTTWGLFRHYWVAAKLLLTILAVIVLLEYTQSISPFVGMAATTTSFSVDHLSHTGGGLLVLLVTTVLAVYKPWGRTRYGRRKQGKQPTVVVP
jgi:hypothetical protein